MTKELEYKSTLEWIAGYDVRERHGYVDEWSQAASFSECQEKAQETLNNASAVSPLEESLKMIASFVDREIECDLKAQIINKDKRNEIHSILVQEMDTALPYLSEVYGEDNVRINRGDVSTESKFCLIEIKSGTWYALEMSMRGEIFYDYDWLIANTPNVNLGYSTRIGFNWDENMIREEFRRVFSQYFKFIYNLAPIKR